MTDYTITTNFGAKDSLPSGNAGKVIKGSEFTTEFTNIQTAVNTKADTAGDTFTGAVNFSADVAVNTNTLFVDVSAAKVGIGTTSPDQKLQVDGNIRLGDTASGVDDDEDYGLITGGQLTIHANDSGNNINYTGLIFDVGNASGAQAASSRVKFKVNNTERMRIDASGNVGIGTDSPLSPLNVKSATGNVGFNYGTSSSPERGNLWYDTDGTEWQFNIGKVQSGTFTPQVTVATSGNVGIGTTSPNKKLHVQDGDVRIESTFPRLYLTDTNNNSDYSIINNNGQFGIYDDTNATYRMVIANTSGNIGIGTDSPDRPLDITDDANDGTGGLVIHSYLPTLELDDISGSGTSFILQHDATNTVFKHDSTERMRIDSSGNVQIGKTSGSTTDAGHQIFGTGQHYYYSTATQVQRFYNVSNGNQVGSISISASATAYNTSSDQRLKDNIADADDAGSKVDAIQVRKFDWIADGSHQDYGMIAQELVTVAPEAVTGDSDSEDMMGVDYSKLVPMLIKEVQSLRSRVAELENV